MLTEQEIKDGLQNIMPHVQAGIEKWIMVSISEQRLYLLNKNKVLYMYPISTSKHGKGCKEGSYQTPFGVHSIAEKVGSGEPFSFNMARGP